MLKLKRIIVLWSLIFSLSCSLFAKPTDVVYLIPENFTGGVIVLYNQPDGITPETTDDGAIIYRIPKDGFLKVKPAFERKNFKFKYYFVDAQDKRTEIEYLQRAHYVRDPGDTTSKSADSITENERNNQIFAMLHETTNFAVSGNRVFIQVFVVAIPKNSLDVYMKTSNKIFDIQEDMLKTTN